MGIDFDVILFFGCELSYETMLRLEQLFGFSVIDALWEEDEMHEFNAKFPRLFLGKASPYIGASDEKLKYYLGIRRNIINDEEDVDGDINEDIKSFDMAELTDLMSQWKTSGYEDFLEFYDIKFVEPKIIALPDINN